MRWREVRTKGRTSTSHALFCPWRYLPVKYYTPDHIKKKNTVGWESAKKYK